ncbi:cupin domain-containing protein [Streptomyces sp. 3MP-14]|uniref:Cupin domain-containing protein n=1 Tax=Streptomyces mimosae TaxID=2586635 RepID=A0A5N5ZST6_9ACTN|nr:MULTISPECIES: cupin domain-containing protein [Streptomyces]KAB8159571.1 cupin domain-containing protein [Streptomyces mimosae]KAB8172849.1 cupin domain-containing protein [Streptomyces sp. 3MP-14]
MSYPERLDYPEARYHGDRGEVNAVFRRADRPPDISSPGGSTHYLATHESTGGEFGLYRVELGARSAGARTHFHRAMSESFYILSGELELYDGERWVTGRAGDFLYVPAGGLHAFRNASAEPMSMLMLFSPGAPREEYFERVAEVARRGGEELRRFRVRHDSYFLEDL